jgi:hypothetical protein
MSSFAFAIRSGDIEAAIEPSLNCLKSFVFQVYRGTSSTVNSDLDLEEVAKSFQV